MPQPVTSLNEFIRAEDLLKHLGLTRAVLGDWIQKGLPFIRIGRRTYFHEPSVATWPKSQERVSVGSGPGAPRKPSAGGGHSFRFAD